MISICVKNVCFIIFFYPCSSPLMYQLLSVLEAHLVTQEKGYRSCPYTLVGTWKNVVLVNALIVKSNKYLMVIAKE